ncbi:MAG TPA: hypothetical protein VL175_04805 [Pirellulales bacterium]|jgi:hypothetical protein|nr:hypothetical protein [Pirellulales bacterium]
MSFLDAFTLVHVVISLLAIASGFVVLYDMLRGKESGGRTAFFLITTVLTSVTGFGFPVDQILPSHILGVLSLVVLGLAIYARYSRRLHGKWRTTYVITAIFALYLNVFVLIVQGFLKIPALHELAPTQTEPPFAIAQLAVLPIFLVLGARAVTGFRAFEPAASKKVGP